MLQVASDDSPLDHCNRLRDTAVHELEADAFSLSLSIT